MTTTKTTLAELCEIVEAKYQDFVKSEAHWTEMADKATENMADYEVKSGMAGARADLCKWFLALIAAKEKAEAAKTEGT